MSISPSMRNATKSPPYCWYIGLVASKLLPKNIHVDAPSTRLTTWKGSIHSSQ
ncbi:MAG: hypothetical protein LM573_06490 [Thermofilum sp.]|nr:hypothetical protein [Thermofilum sp.]